MFPLHWHERDQIFVMRARDSKIGWHFFTTLQCQILNTPYKHENTKQWLSSQITVFPLHSSISSNAYVVVYYPFPKVMFKFKCTLWRCWPLVMLWGNVFKSFSGEVQEDANIGPFLHWHFWGRRVKPRHTNLCFHCQLKCVEPHTRWTISWLGPKTCQTK